jgi:hypothetical protein
LTDSVVSSRDHHELKQDLASKVERLTLDEDADFNIIHNEENEDEEEYHRPQPVA